MELPNINEVQLQTLDQWLSNIVDTFNYDMDKLAIAVPALAMLLTNFDPAPVQYLKDAINQIVNDVNEGFSAISDEIRSLDERITALES